mmetsp:Transcript_44258/g.114425  ORF Transcript_44258/g.114425 Transcript_44258/m.114425 type:complete len:211 (-) Transcript_44258:53-685(-)
MARFMKLLAALAAAALAASVSAEPAASDLAAAALAADDECEAGAKCGLIMLQAKAKAKAAAAAKAVDADLAADEGMETEDFEELAPPMEGEGFDLDAVEDPADLMLLTETTIAAQPGYKVCGKWRIEEIKYGCCNEKPFRFGVYACCGGHEEDPTGLVYDVKKVGCCYHPKASTVKKQVELYWMGKQNCCDRPAGVCTIRSGQYTCCGHR